MRVRVGRKSVISVAHSPVYRRMQANKLATMRASDAYEPRPERVALRVGEVFRHRDGWRCVAVAPSDRGTRALAALRIAGPRII